MQSTLGAKRFDLSMFNAAVLACAFLIGITVGALAVPLLQRDTPAPHPAHAPAASALISANQRFLEINQLPQAALDQPVRATAPAPNYRFLEMNVLPDAARQPTTTTRLWEINVLPGDDAPRVPAAQRTRLQ
jgi:hypothetical protein